MCAAGECRLWGSDGYIGKWTFVSLCLVHSVILLCIVCRTRGIMLNKRLCNKLCVYLLPSDLSTAADSGVVSCMWPVGEYCLCAFYASRSPWCQVVRETY